MILRINVNDGTVINLVPILAQGFEGFEDAPENGANQNMSSIGTEWPDSLGYRKSISVTTLLIETTLANKIANAVKAVPFTLVTDIGGTTQSYAMRADGIRNAPVIPGKNTVSFSAHTINTYE